MKKRLFSFLLVLIMVFSAAAPVYAVDADLEPSQDEEVTVENSFDEDDDSLIEETDASIELGEDVREETGSDETENKIEEETLAEPVEQIINEEEIAKEEMDADEESAIEDPTVEADETLYEKDVDVIRDLELTEPYHQEENITFLSDDTPVREEEIQSREEETPEKADEVSEESLPSVAEETVTEQTAPSEESGKTSEEQANEDSETAAETPETADERISVVFICEPEQTAVIVYNIEETDENEQPVPIEREADGSYLLLPGEYRYIAGYDGYESVEKNFFVVAGDPLTISIVLPVKQENENEREIEKDEINMASVRSGTCGENLTWSYDGNGALTISGTGAMNDYWDGDQPWFEFREEVTKLVIKNGVTSVGRTAFSGFSNLYSITWPNTLTAIYQSAFTRCSSLESLVLPEGLVSIDIEAFFGCYALTSVSFPSTLQELPYGSGTFWDGSNLTEVKVSSSNPYFCSIDNVMYSKDLTKLVMVPNGFRGTFVIPNQVRIIGDSAFGANHLTSVVIPEGVTEIQRDAFARGTIEGAISLPSTVSYIAPTAFRANPKISEYIVASSNSSYCSIEGVLYTKDKSTLMSCPGGQRETVHIPPETRELATDSFSAAQLSYLVVPSTVETLGSQVFCTSEINRIILPDNLTELGQYFFSWTSAINEIHLPASLRSIPYGCVAYCYGLTEIEIPAAVTYVGDSAFADCSALKKITFSGAAPEFTPTCFSGVTATAYYPAYDASWTENVRQNYGGNLTWKPLNAIQLSVSPKSGATMSLSWKTINGAASYEIWYSTNGTDFTVLKSVGANQTSTSHTSLTAGTLYYYTILAKNGNGAVIAGSEVREAVALATPTLKTAEASETGIKLNWTKASGADRYNIYRSTEENGTYSYLESVQNGLNYTDTKASSGTTYFYKVRAYKKINGTVYYGGYSNSIDGKWVKVNSLSAEPKSGVTISLSWNVEKGANSIDLLYSANGTTFTVLKTVGASQTSTSHTGLTAGTRYFYKLSVKDKDGKIIGISPVRAAVALATPTLSSVKSGATGITLSWSKASGADRYNIYRSSSENGTYSYLESVQKTEKYTDTQVSDGVTYYYKIRAYKKFDGTVYYGGYSNSGGAPYHKTIELSVAPKSGVTISLNWSAVSGAKSYEIQHSTDGINYSVLKSAGANQLSSSHTGLAAGSLHYYVVLAKDQNGNELSRSSVKATCALATPTINSSIFEDDSKIVLNWSKASGADRYNVYRSLSPDGPYTYLQSVQHAESYTDTTIEYGETYYYKVRAYKKFDGQAYYSGWSGYVSVAAH